MLEARGYTKISEASDADFAGIRPGGKYYFTRNQSTIFAFAVGGKWAPGQGVTIVAAHTDSPVYRLKPKTKVQKQGFVQVGVECYGGGLWYTYVTTNEYNQVYIFTILFHSMAYDTFSIVIP